MPITTMAMALNFAIIIATWTSELSLSEKIVLTAIVIGKYLLFTFFVYLSSEERIRKSCNTLCIVLNTGMIIFSGWMGAYLITLTTAMLLVPLLIWSSAAIYDFGA